jgi:hypothetical protein
MKKKELLAMIEALTLRVDELEKQIKPPKQDPDEDLFKRLGIDPSIQDLFRVAQEAIEKQKEKASDRLRRPKKWDLGLD